MADDATRLADADGTSKTGPLVEQFNRKLAALADENAHLRAELTASTAHRDSFREQLEATLKHNGEMIALLRRAVDGDLDSARSFLAWLDGQPALARYLPALGAGA